MSDPNGAFDSINPEDVGCAPPKGPTPDAPQGPRAAPDANPPFDIGDIVTAADRDNLGEVIAVQPSNVQVRFTDKHSGRVADVYLPTNSVRLVRRQPEVRELHVLTYGELMDLPPAQWLIRDVLRLGELGVLFGPPGSMKTFVALSMGLAVANGSEWWGRAVRPGRVLYVAAEGLYSIRLRAKAWHQQFGYEGPVYAALEANFTVLGDAVSFVEPEFELLIAYLSSCSEPFVLIVVDTLARCMAGGDENSSKDMGTLVRSADRIRKLTGAAVLLVHHSGKADEASERGSSSLRGAADAMFAVSRESDTKPIIRLKCSKQKEGEQFPDLGLELDVVEVGIDEEGVSVRSGRLKLIELGQGPCDGGERGLRESPAICIQRVLSESFFENGASGSELRSTTGLRSSTFHRHLKVLCEAGMVRRQKQHGHDRYCLTAASSFYSAMSGVESSSPAPSPIESQHSHGTPPMESHSHSHSPPLGGHGDGNGTGLPTEGRIHE